MPGKGTAREGRLVNISYSFEEEDGDGDEISELSVLGEAL